jgi:hypothetical protein
LGHLRYSSAAGRRQRALLIGFVVVVGFDTRLDIQEGVDASPGFVVIERS